MKLGFGQHTGLVTSLQTNCSLMGESLSMRLLGVKYDLLELFRKLSLLAILALLSLLTNQVAHSFNTPCQLGLLAHFLFASEMA